MSGIITSFDIKSFCSCSKKSIGRRYEGFVIESSGMCGARCGIGGGVHSTFGVGETGGGSGGGVYSPDFTESFGVG